jgi:hypothetical protein
MILEQLKELKDRIEFEFDVDLATRERTRKMAYLRGVFFSVAHKTLNLPLYTIGSIVNRNHSTVIHSLRNIAPTLEVNEPILNEYRNELMLWMLAPDKEAQEIRLQIKRLKKKLKLLEQCS